MVGSTGWESKTFQKIQRNSPAPLGFAVTGAVSCSALAQGGKDLSYP